jgi:hypothetical protein
VIADIVRFADLREERIDDDLDKPDMAQHPKYERGPKQKKQL